MKGLLKRLPATPLERLRLAALMYGCLGLPLISLVGSPLHPPAWHVASAAAVVLLGALLIVTYRRKQTFWFEPALGPVLAITAGSGFVDPFMTCGLMMGVLVSNSLYGTHRGWLIRSVGALLSVPIAVALTPMALGRPISWASPTVFGLLPQFVLQAILIRGVYTILQRQIRTFARTAVLARASSRLLGATDPALVSATGREAAAELVALSPRVEAVDGGVPRAGRGRVIPEEILDAFRNLANQVALAEANCASHAELHNRAQQLQTNMKQLGDAQRRLIDLSRQAGMADVASSVVRNVGHALDSVNSSVSVIGSSITGSKAGGLGTMVALLGQNRGDLGRYLTQDERGRRMPEELTELVEVLDGERAGLLVEVKALQTNLEHISSVVAMQQSHARGGVMIEDVTLAGLLEDAIRMSAVSLGNSEVAIVRNYGEIPTFAADRHKILQIATNLITNARRAVVGAADPTIVVRSSSTDHTAVIVVEDRGIGVAEADLLRVFNHSFSTKPTDHGFGLHASANAAKVIGAELSCQSEGLGKGATFTLTIPLPATRSEAVAS